MDKKFLIIVIFAVIFLSLSAFNARADSSGNRSCTGVNYTEQGGDINWSVNTTVVCLGGNMAIKGNITVASNASLYLQNVNMSFNGSVDGLAIHVYGILKIDNGSQLFSRNGTALGYSIFFYGGSSGFINNSSISALQNFSGSNGIMINTTNFEMANVTINNSLGYALNISSGSPTIKNSTLFNNPGGIVVWNASPIITNVTIKLTADTTTDAGLNITNSNNASITNVTLFNQTFGIVLTNSNLTFNNITIDNSTYGIFPKSNSRTIFIDTIIQSVRSMGSTGFPTASAVYFNVSSNESNITFVNVNYDNYSFSGNSTANFTVKWYLDIYTATLSNYPLSYATVTANNTTTWFTDTTNINGTFPSRKNLTEHIFFVSNQTLAVLNVSYYNYTFNAIKGTSWGINTTNLTSNKIGGSNMTIQLNNMIVLTGLVNGSGNASINPGASIGYFVQDAVLTFNTTFNATTNGVGNYSVALPNGSYDVLMTATNYTNSSTATAALNFSVSTANFTMLPKILLIRKYTWGSFPANYTFMQSAIGGNQNVTKGASYTISGNATYAHNNKSVNGTLYYYGTNSRDGTTITQSAVVFSNSSNNGLFSQSKTAPTPSSTSDYNFSISVWVNETYGSNGTANDWLIVYGGDPSANVSTGDGGGGGGGGGGEGAGNYQLTITEYERKITMAQGESKVVKVSVKNTGLRALEDVGLVLNGITASWYKANVSTTNLATEDLSSAETVVFNVRITIPSGAIPKNYAGTWRAKDKDSLAIAERAMNLTVTQVWTTATIAALNNSLTSLEKIFADLQKNFTSIKGSLANVSQFETRLKTINDTIKQARASFDSGEYDAAKTSADQVSTDISAFVADVESVRGKGAAAVILEAFKSPLGIVLIGGVIAAAGLGGFFIWWLFFRIISIGEVKKNPAKFAGGVRLAGVVKSITDTKKGKVFLIADTSGERLHVRYPYYTTTEVGDLIRVGGVVKIYKEIPYMDATELSRVSMKPTTTK